LFWRKSTAAIPFLRDGETAGKGESDTDQGGSSTGGGTTQGTNQSVTDGTSDTEGTSTNEQTSKTEAIGGSVGETDTTTETTSIAEQETVQEGSQRGVSVGQVFHKRALITSDQIREYFARLGRDDHAYPGLGMLKISGERWAITQRSYYFDDHYFDGFWDKHPTHAEYPPADLWRTTDYFVPLVDLGELVYEGHKPTIARWLYEPGEAMIQGEPMFEISPGARQAGLVDTRLTVPVPISGVLQSISSAGGDEFDPSRPMCVIHFHLSELED
jgi:hypothetical protein